MRIVRFLVKSILSLVILYLLLILVFYAFFNDNNYNNPAQSESAKDGQFITLSAGDIFYREAGLGQKVILLHGFGSSSASFLGLMTELSKDFRVFALDFPGFGLSAKQKEEDLTLASQVKTVLEFMDQKNMDKAFIVAHDMGGAVAAKLAIDYPNRVEKLVLIAPEGYGQDLRYNYLKYIPPPLDRLFLRLFMFNSNAVKKTLEKAFYDDEQVTKDIINNYVESYKTKRADWAFSKKIKQGLSPDLTAQFSQIKASTLVIWGRQDELIKSTVMEELNHQMPEVTGYFIENTGHLPQQESPEGVADLITSFLIKIL